MKTQNKHYFQKICMLLLFSLSGLTYSQKEANNWYFGNKAALDFNNGGPAVLDNSEMDTGWSNGCSTISDNDGNLLFYTNGHKIWNRNHQIMENGEGLIPAMISYATSRTIIIPKPNDPNIYYIFSLDGIQNSNRFYYAEIDMRGDSGLGTVTSKHIYLRAMAVKITAVLHDNGTDVWVMVHGYNNNNFYAYLVTASGVNHAPVISSAGSVIERVGDHYEGGRREQMKFAPNGKKIAMAIMGIGIELFDFDNETGRVSNPRSLLVLDPFDPDSNFDGCEGIEFSPSSNVLYATKRAFATFVPELLLQYDLLSNDIPGSQTIVSSAAQFGGPSGTLQLAPDGKIYLSDLNKDYIGIIEEPEKLGTSCNYQPNGILVLPGIPDNALPAFIQSYFRPAPIQYEATCFHDTTSFSLNTNPDSVIWNFGDPASGANNVSNLLNPTHIFSAPGTYMVTATTTTGTQTIIETETIIIHPNPIVVQPNNMILCESDGIADFDFTTQTNTILSSVDPAQFEVAYFKSMSDLTNNIRIINTTAYQNTAPFSQETIYARVFNIYGRSCDAVVSFTISVDRPLATVPSITTMQLCDDTSFGTDTDGLITFDLTQKEPELLDGQTISDVQVRYFTDAGFTQPISDPTAFTNTSRTQVIYCRIESVAITSCTETASFSIHVQELPSVADVVTLRQCDDDIDGISLFNLNEVVSEISNTVNDVEISFFESLSDAQNNLEMITNTTQYQNEVVTTDTIWARVENQSGCYSTSEVVLQVSTTQIPSSFLKEFYACDLGDNVYDGITTFDFSSANDDIVALFPSNQQLTISYYQSETEAYSEQNPITDISNYQNTNAPNEQAIYVRVDSAIGNDCLGVGPHILLKVDQTPIFDLMPEAILCMTGVPALNIAVENPRDTYSYTWTDASGTVVGNLIDVTVTQSGIYSVYATSANGCSSPVQQINIIESTMRDLTISDVEVIDDSQNNTVVVVGTNFGPDLYEFALFDTQNNLIAGYQTGREFHNLESGIYILEVRDISGCEKKTFEVAVLSFPKFFTPNGDGINDTWHIRGVARTFYQEARVVIFDRYGKIVGQLTMDDPGWNGNFGGRPLPPNDYWFSIQLIGIDGTIRNKKGHFSLIRE